MQEAEERKTEDQLITRLKKLSKELETLEKKYESDVVTPFIEMQKRIKEGNQKMIATLITVARTHSLHEVKNMLENPVYEDVLRDVSLIVNCENEEAKQFLINYCRFKRVS